MRNDSIWINTEGCREVLASMEGAKADKEAAINKSKLLIGKLRLKRFHQASDVIEKGIEVIRRMTRVIESFPVGVPALMLVTARLHHIASTQWGTKKYLDVEKLSEIKE